MNQGTRGLFLLFFFVFPASAWAQSFVVDGRVTDRNGTPIANALVELDGHDPQLTSAGGAFRFDDIASGDYTLRIRALGYVAVTRPLTVSENVTVVILLEPSALQLDPIVIVAPREIDIRGHVEDQEEGRRIMDADILTSQGHSEITDTHGRFRVDALEGVPVLLAVRAFGYLPFDSVVTPNDDDRYAFTLTVDPLVERMIAVEMERLDERAGGHRAITMPAMNRGELSRWYGMTLTDVLQAKFPMRRRRVGCIVFDEKVVPDAMMLPILEMTFVQEVERMEFLFNGGMLRIYSREFMRRMIGGGLELRRPGYSDMIDPPLCS